MTAICEQGRRLKKLVAHDQVEAKVVDGLAWCVVRSQGQARAVDAEVELSREATS